MAYTYERTQSLGWSVADQITAPRLQDINDELDSLFTRLDDRNLSLTYDVQGRLTQIIDNTNAIIVNISRVDIVLNPPKIYIQEVWDPNRYTIQYLWSVPSSILYWP